ncbi:MAG: OmpA family protein [Pseudomonadota bacterium]
MRDTKYRGYTLISAALAAAIMAGCASTPKKPAGSEAVRAKLTSLQSDATLAGRAPVAIKDAEAAVRIAETSQKDLSLAAHRVYIADRKVDTARALAETKAAEAERVTLNEASERARLDSRTREADVAKAAAMVAKADAANARADTDAARLAAGAAEQQSALAQAEALELQRQVALLQARPTDRGLVLTLGDTLFATGKAELKSGASANLDRITKFMNEYPNRTAAIEGFTDSMGSDEYNNDLSQRRADSVKRYLVGQGVSNDRLSASGRGENSPVGDNETAAGRQQNRRVEVVINQMPAPGAN